MARHNVFTHVFFSPIPFTKFLSCSFFTNAFYKVFTHVFVHPSFSSIFSQGFLAMFSYTVSPMFSTHVLYKVFTHVFFYQSFLTHTLYKVFTHLFSPTLFSPMFFSLIFFTQSVHHLTLLSCSLSAYQIILSAFTIFFHVFFHPSFLIDDFYKVFTHFFIFFSSILLTKFSPMFYFSPIFVSPMLFFTHLFSPILFTKFSPMCE